MLLGGTARAADKFEEISMKRIVGGMVVAAALSGSAFATDLPLPKYTKAPAIMKAHLQSLLQHTTGVAGTAA